MLMTVGFLVSRLTLRVILSLHDTTMPTWVQRRHCKRTASNDRGFESRVLTFTSFLIPN